MSIYYSLAYSHLAQSLVLWGGGPESEVKPVRVIMNKIFRAILNVRYNELHIPTMRTEHMYKSLGVLQLQDVYKYFFYSNLLDPHCMKIKNYLTSFICHCYHNIGLLHEIQDLMYHQYG